METTKYMRDGIEIQMDSIDSIVNTYLQKSLVLPLESGGQNLG
jgi:hypothetical protein